MKPPGCAPYPQTRPASESRVDPDAQPPFNIYARLNLTIPNPTSYAWEPMQLMWL